MKIVDSKGRNLVKVGESQTHVLFRVVGGEDDGSEIIISKTDIIDNIVGVTHGKRAIDVYCDVLVYGQLFVDELEHLSTFKDSLFRYGLKMNVVKVIKEFRGVVNRIFDNTKKKNELVKLYDINYELLSKINGLTIDEKFDLVNVFDSVVKGLKTSYKEVRDS